MLPEIITIELPETRQYEKKIVHAKSIKEGTLSAMNILPGAENSTGLIRCVKALHLPKNLMEIAWVTETNGAKVFEGIYSVDTHVSVYTLITKEA